MRQHSCSYVALDVETTGLYPQRGARIIEIGAVTVEYGHIVGEFANLVNCGRDIPGPAQKVHGITTEMLLGQPTPEEVYPNFLKFVAGRTLVAHNAKFDVKFLRYELARLGLGLSNKTICTLKMSKKLFPELQNHKLETVARHLLGELPAGLRLHRALDDAKLTARVWMEMEGRK